jgi:hypothetical protein
MRDHSLKQIVLFAVFFVALFAALFASVVQVHNRKLQQHATAHYVPATPAAAPTN